jgi:hypothetical protein
MATPAKSASTPQAHCWVDATLAPGARVELPPELAHHLGRVLRLQDGDSVTLFDGRDPVWLATARTAGTPHRNRSHGRAGSHADAVGRLLAAAVAANAELLEPAVQVGALQADVLCQR